MYVGCNAGVLGCVIFCLFFGVSRYCKMRLKPMYWPTYSDATQLQIYGRIDVFCRPALLLLRRSNNSNAELNAIDHFSQWHIRIIRIFKCKNADKKEESLCCCLCHTKFFYQSICQSYSASVRMAWVFEMAVLMRRVYTAAIQTFDDKSVLLLSKLAVALDNGFCVCVHAVLVCVMCVRDDRRMWPCIRGHMKHIHIIRVLWAIRYNATCSAIGQKKQ